MSAVVREGHGVLMARPCGHGRASLVAEEIEPGAVRKTCPRCGQVAVYAVTTAAMPGMLYRVVERGVLEQEELTL